ncbi:MAG: hypothetical protein QM775_31640 [Pirellulales bacterium]
MTTTADRYPSVVRELLLPAGMAMPLDAGTANESARARLAKLKPADVVPDAVDAGMAEACLSGLWLLHNFLDSSHRISQDLHSTTGSYWHAIMHRREGDYDNSKYWFRQVGAHPAFVSLRQAARNEYLRDSPGRSDTTRAFAPLDILTLLDGERAWNPYAFVDLCKAACHGRGDLEKSCRTIQMLEWRTLFDYCYDRAARGDA